MPHSQQEILDATLESLTHLVCSDRENRWTAPVHKLRPMDFDGYEPLIDDDDDNDKPGILVGDHPGDQPVWPIDVAMAMSANTDWPDGSWQFDRFMTLKPSEWRGKITKVFPRMIDRRIMISFPGGSHTSLRVPYAIIGKKLIEAPRTDTGMQIDSPGDGSFGIPPHWWGRKTNTDAEKGELFAVRLLGGLALRRRYHWSVLLGESAGPRVRFITDPAGMREIFRFRDIPPGRLRRAALLHWVKAHWRQRRAPTANDRAWIRQHLRGTWSYDWNGLRCQIEPSEYDLEKAIIDTQH